MWLVIALVILVISILCGAIVLSSRQFQVPLVEPSAALATGHPYFALLAEASANLATAVDNNGRRYRGKRAWYWWQLNTFVSGVVFVVAALFTGMVS
jgi:hypothetical protein